MTNPTTAGQIVRHIADGTVGITTGDAKAYTGNIAAMFPGARWECSFSPLELEVIEGSSMTVIEPERTAVERELHPTGDEATDLAIYHAETAATYKGRDDSVRIPKADLLLILAAARR